MKKVFKFFDESGEDSNGWWDEVYCMDYNHHYSLVSVLDACVSLLDKEKLTQMPELAHLNWPDVSEYLFSEIDNLNIKSLEKPLLGLGYNITIDGVCIFSYDTQHQGYAKSVSGAYTSLPTLVNKYNSDKVFILKLEQLLGDSGVKCSGEDTMTAFLNLVHIRNKVAEVLPYLVDSSNI